MNHINIGIQFLALSLLAWPTGAFAQQAPAAGNPRASGVPAAAAQVPRLIKFSGAVKDVSGKPVSSMAGITFGLYEDQQGGTPLWTENQNVQPDAAGRYTVWLGATKNEGLPVELFASGQARWLGVQVEGQPEQARVLLAAVPYALKAADAEAVGGLPPSAFLLAGVSAAGGHAVDSNPRLESAAGVTPAVGGSGTQSYIPIWTDSAGDLGNSVMYQNGSNIGIGTASPGQLLTLQTGATGYTFLENLYGSVDPGNGATRLEVGNPVSSLMLTAYGSKAPGILGGSAGVVSLAGPLLVGNAAAKAPLYLYAGNAYTAPQFTITSTGNIGIGTQTPAATLEVKGNAQVDGNLTLSGCILSPSSSVPIIQAPTNGSGNFSAGLGALPPATTGTYNTAVGDNALQSNTTGYDNTAVGDGALYSNTTGGVNTAIGEQALYSNTTGGSNTASGFDALDQNTTGYANTASGALALFGNTVGCCNTASGDNALYHNTTGINNTAMGTDALWTNSTGSNNIAIGDSAGYNVTSTSNNIDIGNGGAASDTGAIRIGTVGTQTSAFIAGISNTNISGAAVLVNSNGQLGVASSSRHYKEDIQDMGDTSSGLLRLRPVTFRYKKPFDDGSKPIQYGLIAEEVAEVYPDLVARSADGQIETVKYQLLDSMLLNELQKQNTIIAAQKEQIRSLEERLARVEAAVSGTTATASR